MYINVYADEKYCVRLMPEKLVVSHPTSYSLVEARKVAVRLERFLNCMNRGKYYMAIANRTPDMIPSWSADNCSCCGKPRHSKLWAKVHCCKHMEERREKWPHSMMKNRRKVTSLSQIPNEVADEILFNLIVEYLGYDKAEDSEKVFSLLEIPGVFGNMLDFFWETIVYEYNIREGI